MRSRFVWFLSVRLLLMAAAADWLNIREFVLLSTISQRDFMVDLGSPRQT